MNVIVDTNILRNDFLFHTVRPKHLLDYLLRTDSILVVPQVVLEESCALYENLLRSKRDAFKKALFEYLGLSGRSLPVEADRIFSDIFQDKHSYYPKYHLLLLDKLSWHFHIIPYRHDYLPEVIQRAIRRIKPGRSKGGEFRDVVLWLSVLDFLKLDKNTPSVFITNNSKDFSGENTCELHEMLKNELVLNDLRLDYYTSLDCFLDAYAFKTKWASKEWLLNALDWEKLNAQVLQAVDEIHEGYYMTLYERSDTVAPGFCYHGVQNIVIDREQTEYYLREQRDGYHELNLSFFGTTNIHYYQSNDEFEVITTGFRVDTTAKCFNEQIIEYSGMYYEEECTLYLPDLISSNP